MSDRLLNRAQVAERLGVKVRWVIEHQAEIGYIKLGHHVRFDLEDVEAYIEAQRPAKPLLAGRR